jgi:hypothetical protein
MEKDRKQLLISLFPYIDESKLAGNLKKECGIQNFWEDENLDYKMNNLKVSENGLLTPMKIQSFNEHLSIFQNSIIASNDSLISEPDLVEKSLLLL